ncbi:MAG TPA: NADP-dependent oxidoreductase [Streptosporangiaceae bacterium]|nr:NADP-dependent oxidoreductase [Streptosporangiaceae bacterium]
MGTMMALRAHARGGPEQLVYEQATEPSAVPGEVLIAVHAAAITFAELTWDLEWTTRDGKDRTPIIPAHEMSGIVAGVGAAGLATGDEVIGLVDFDRDGAAAEYVVMPAASLAAKPQSLSHVAAATLPLAALTAWQALADHAALKPGERVLVQGGAGGVGIFAVQLAAILGGHVTATGHSADADFVRELGADRFISAEAGQTNQAAGEFDVVIDTVGGAVLDGSYSLLREGGRLVTLGAPPDQELAGRYKIHAMFFIVEPNAKELARLAEMAGTGKLRAVISQTFPLAEGQKAFESGQAARGPGKTVLVVR